MSTIAPTQTCRLLLLLLCGCYLLLCPARAAAQPGEKDPLALGNLYYKADDVSDRAAREYRAVIRRYAGKPEAETAQYMLASYYHRKYYIMRDKLKKTSPAALKTAAAEYRRYTDTYYSGGTHKWLSEAFFNLALVYLEQKDFKSADNELSKANRFAAQDKYVYVYKVVWSPDYEDIVDGYLDASGLAQYAHNLLATNNNPAAIINALVDWCQKNNRKSI